MRSALRLVAINLGLILLVCLAAELGFGDWFSVHKLGMLNVHANEDTWFDVSRMYPRAEPVHYTRDRWGLRGDFASPDQVDILAVGGSTTNQFYVDDSATWTRVLQRDFAAEGRHVVVANAGIDGHSTFGHLQSMREWLPHIPGLRPKYVLYFVGVNDTGLGLAGGPRDVMSNPRWDRRLGDLLRNNSAIYRLVATAAGMLKAQRLRLRHQLTSGTPITWSPFAPPSLDQAQALFAAGVLDAYADRLRRLGELAAAMGAQPIFVTQQRASYRRAGELWLKASGDSFPGDPGVRDYAEMLAFNSTTLAVCREGRGICIDLGAELETQPGDYYDFVHTTEQGSLRIGHFLHDRLTALLPSQ